MTGKLERKLLLTALRLVLRPVVRFCFRHSIKIQEIVELSKVAFLDLARAELAARGERVTDSRLSVMTGLHRRDVSRLAREEIRLDKPIDLITKVIGQWQQDSRFVTKDGSPRALSTGADSSDFNELVRSVSRELNPATILCELERVGAVRWSKKHIKLVVEAYSPRGDVQAGFKILSDDIEDLMLAVEDNVIAGPAIPNLHSRTEYDRVRPDAVPEIRRWLLREGHALHEKARSFIAQFDQDVHPSDSYKGKTVKVALCTFARPVFKDERGK